jgi:hypothetical protein
MSIEIIVLFCSNWRYLNKPFTNDEIKGITDESREYNKRALTFSALIFTAIALLFNAFRTELAKIEDALLIMVFCFALFMCSYKIEVLTNMKRIIWVIQEKLLNFGYLGALSAIGVLFYFMLPQTWGIIIIFLIVIVIIHCWEFYFDFKKYRDMSKANK